MLDENLINLAYEGVSEADPFCSFLYEFRAKLNSISSSLMVGLPSTSIIMPDIGSTDKNVVSMRRAYFSHYYQMNPIQYRSMEYGRAYSLYDFVHRDHFVTTPFYREYCQVLGFDHTLVAYVGEVEDAKVWLNVTRGSELGAYRPDDAALMLSMIPHVHRALKISGALRKAKREKSAYMEGLDRMNLGTILLNEEGEIVEMNGQSERLLSRSSVLSVAGDRIMMADRADQSKFNSLLESITSGEGDVGFGALKIGKFSDDPVNLIIRRVKSGGTFGKKRSFPAIVFLKNAHEQFHAKTEVIAELYGLTLTEARLAVAIVNGASTKEVAATLKMSEHTIRTYLKRILQKTGAPRQSALVKLISTGLAAMA
jgi:DNA-binding CsgD family transcriptional regulator/PAS domain-containing protein